MNSNLYQNLKYRHQQEVNNFPMFFAFSNAQFEEGMNKLGLEASETDKILSLGGGGYLLKTDRPAFKEMFDRHQKEMQEARANDQFLYDAFDYKLGNHEYCITWDIEPTLDALGLTEEEVENDARMSAILRKARQAQSEWYSKHG